jgi:hypothetical protein
VCLLGALWWKVKRSAIGTSGDHSPMVPENPLTLHAGRALITAMRRTLPQIVLADAVVCLLGTPSFSNGRARSAI